MALTRRQALAGLGTAATSGGVIAVGRAAEIFPTRGPERTTHGLSTGETGQEGGVPTEKLDEAAAGPRLLLTVDPTTVTVAPDAQVGFRFTVRNTSQQGYNGIPSKTFAVSFPDGLLNGWPVDAQFNSGVGQWTADAVLGNPGWEWDTTFLEGDSLDAAEMVQTTLVFRVPADAAPGTTTWPVHLAYAHGEQTERLEVTVRNTGRGSAETTTESGRTADA